MRLSTVVRAAACFLCLVKKIKSTITADRIRWQSSISYMRVQQYRSDDGLGSDERREKQTKNMYPRLGRNGYHCYNKHTAVRRFFSNLGIVAQIGVKRNVDIYILTEQPIVSSQLRRATRQGCRTTDELELQVPNPTPSLTQSPISDTHRTTVPPQPAKRAPAACLLHVLRTTWRGAFIQSNAQSRMRCHC